MEGAVGVETPHHADATEVTNAEVGAGEMLEEQVNGLSLSNNEPELELHRLCAEGKLDEVRAVLSKGMSDLEGLGR